MLDPVNFWSVALAPTIGFVGTLVGSGTILISQRSGRTFDARRADDQLIRDKAALVFEELSRMRRDSNPALVASMTALMVEGAAQSASADAPPMPNTDRLAALLACYFPDGLPILDRHQKELESEMAPIYSALKAKKIKPSVELNADMKAATLVATHRNALTLQATASELHAFMIDYLRQYTPARAASTHRLRDAGYWLRNKLPFLRRRARPADPADPQPKALAPAIQDMPARAPEEVSQ